MITENNIYLPDFQALLAADVAPLSFDLDEQSTCPSSFTYKALLSPPVLPKCIKTPADDKTQRRLDQFSIKPVTASGDACLVSADHSGQQNSSFVVESPSSALPQSELSKKTPSTNRVSIMPEEIDADINKLTVMKEAKEHLQCARKRKAPPNKIRMLKSKFNNTKRDFRRSFILQKLEANLSKEQIAQIKNESNKCAPDKKDEHNFVMKHIKKHVDKRLTSKYTLKVLCAAIVNGQTIAIDGTEQRILFLECKKWATKALQDYSYRKRHAEYIRLLKMANGIAEKSIY